MGINEESGVTPYRQVMADIRHQIAYGALSPGDKLPPQSQIMSTYGVSLATASKAIDGLQRQGVVLTKRGRGTYVADPPEVMRVGAGRYRRADGQAPNDSEMRSNGGTYEIHGEVGRMSAPKVIARRLGLEEGDQVSTATYRWVTDDEVPVQHSTQYEPLALTRNTDAEVPPESGEPDVITRYDSIGWQVDQVTERTRSRMPSSDESRDLQIPEGVPVVTIERTHYAGTTPVETADIVIRADRVVITSTHTVDHSSQE